MVEPLHKLPGIGPKSAKRLNEIGIFTRSDLTKVGPVAAFVKLQQLPNYQSSLNLLYAIVGALEGKNWTDIAKNEKSRLLAELDGYNDFQETLDS